MSFNELELLESGYIHVPLPLHRENSLEADMLKTAVDHEEILHALSDIRSWFPVGDAAISSSTEITPGQNPCVCFHTPLAHDTKPMGRLTEGDCSNYGSTGFLTRINREDWTGYNRIRFSLKADCAGIRRVAVRLSFQNEGTYRIPDIYNREGVHSMNLVSGEWTDVTLDIDTLPRDCITALCFDSGMVGCETNPDLGNSLTVTLGDVRLQQTSVAETTLGWALPAGKIAYCYSGYLPTSRKTAVAGVCTGTPFSIIGEDGETVFSGVSTGCPGYPQVSVLDFSCVQQEGIYHIHTDTGESDKFPVSKHAFTPSVWKSINVFFCQRCGYPVPGIHQRCHRDILAHHNGQSLPCSGGWHDAGDLSQQLIQTAEITYSLFESAAAFPDNLPLTLRLREEALWGLDYVLQSRFGDGYRATSVGISMWTKGFIGDQDDLHSRMHNNAYENFLCAGIEAYCSRQLTCTDPQLAGRVLACARADFDFAKARFALTGYNETPPEYWEHSYMTSPSLFAAAISWAATELYRSTGQRDYADTAAEYGDYVLSCQAVLPAAGTRFPARGFFYRSSDKKSLQHFNHQARDQYYMMALIGLCSTQPEHPSFDQWFSSIQLYGDYLKALEVHGNPYGMMPSGLYRPEEINEESAFLRQHLETGEEVHRDYIQQLEQGVSLGGGFYLKQFPVWFSFRGNNAVILSMGKSASMCGIFLKDQQLLDIASAQLEWNIGKNPFRQSLMYGEGRRYAQQYSVMSGEITGELPVGVQTMGNGDEPYWPQMNNATYKEVWTTPSARWLSIIADLNTAL